MTGNVGKRGSGEVVKRGGWFTGQNTYLSLSSYLREAWREGGTRVPTRFMYYPPSLTASRGNLSACPHTA